MHKGAKPLDLSKIVRFARLTVQGNKKRTNTTTTNRAKIYVSKDASGICVYTYTDMHLFVCAGTCVCGSACMCVSAYIHIHTHIIILDAWSGPHLRNSTYETLLTLPPSLYTGSWPQYGRSSSQIAPVRGGRSALRGPA